MRLFFNRFESLVLKNELALRKQSSTFNFLKRNNDTSVFLP